MPETREELALPEFEDRLWAELEALFHERLPSPPRRPRRRLAVVAAGLATAAAAIAAVVAVGPDPTPDHPRTSQVPSDAEVVRNVHAAHLATAGTMIVHETDIRADPGLDRRELWFDQVTSASRLRWTAADGDVLTDAGWPEPPGIDEAPGAGTSPPVTGLDQCDPGTGLALSPAGELYPCDPGARPPQPTHQRLAIDFCHREYATETGPIVRYPGAGYVDLFLQTGDFVVDGIRTVDGRDLIRVHSRNPGGAEALIDPDTWLPVQTSLDVGGATVTRYEYLPRTPENLALLTPRVPAGFTAVDSLGSCTRNSPDDILPGEVEIRGGILPGQVEIREGESVRVIPSDPAAP